MKPDNNTVALIGLTIIIVVSIVMGVEGSKEIALAIGGGIAGWLSKNNTP